ncbi:shikimate dehydrogenase family protein [Microbacterium luticocti]|uniref:shikimate dehydrogenase family protein n=1 Tax=Microbacterium luticocti TaxID=451764 RepID=UPI000429E30B|nr:shikimate dehydrogenase [Microbacterium luticocti]
MLIGPDLLAVWGDPIAHSLSPVLHTAAYRALGLDWRYTRRRVDAASFGAALHGLDASWRGLSLTMPLKTPAFRAARTRDRRAELSGAVNTLLLTDDGPHGFNTDVGGIARDLRTHGLAGVGSARVIGAGATATSAVLALAELGATAVEVAARRVDSAAPLVALGERIGVAVHAVPLDAAGHEPTPLTVAALPGGAQVPDEVADAAAAGGGILYDVVYGQWPTDLARAWQRAGGTAVPGRGMLTEQALLQVRVFVHGDPDTPLPDEPAVLAAMRAAVTGD